LFPISSLSNQDFLKLPPFHNIVHTRLQFSQSGKQWNPQNWHLPCTHSSLKNKTFESFGDKYNSHRLELLLYTWWWAWRVKLPTTTPLGGLEHTLS
jgi:hypothetical protein